MKTGAHKSLGIEQAADRKSTGTRLELLVNNAFDVLGLRRDVKELRRVADFCTSVTASLDPDKVLTAAAQKFYDYFNFKLLVITHHFDFGEDTVAFYPGRPELLADNFQITMCRFPGLEPENIRGYQSLGLSVPHNCATDGFVNSYELPDNTGLIRIVTDSDIYDNHTTAFMTRVLDTLAVSLRNAVEFGKVKEDSIRDSLTGLYNRRVLEEMLELEDRKRGVNPLSLLLIDLDNFKAINDTYGHPCGDMVLQAAAGVLKEKARGSDLVVRNGGEEFAVMLPAASATVALEVGERFRKSIENTVIEYNGSMVRLTASIGIAHRPVKDHFPAKEIIVQADEALYQAKRTGKNKVCFYSSSPVLVGSN